MSASIHSNANEKGIPWNVRWNETSIVFVIHKSPGGQWNPYFCRLRLAFFAQTRKCMIALALLITWLPFNYEYTSILNTHGTTLSARCETAWLTGIQPKLRKIHISISLVIIRISRYTIFADISMIPYSAIVQCGRWMYVCVCQKETERQKG